MKNYLVKNHEGHTLGPFEAEKVGKLLREGVFGGEELVCQYPHGDWKPMAQFPELYDLILETLEGIRPPVLAPTETSEPQQAAPEEKIERTKPQFKIILGGTKTKKAPPIREASALIDIPMGNEERVMKEAQGLFGKIAPTVLILVGAGILYYALTLDTRPPPKNTFINLLSIKIAANPDPNKSRELVKKGTPFFLSDKFTNYQKAQEYFVRALEADPKNAEAAALLALTDYELWPHTKKDSSDQGVLRTIQQLVTLADPYGAHRSVSIIAIDMATKRDLSAKSMIDTALSSFPSDGRLYYLKARLFLDSSDYSLAFAYFQKVATLAKGWVAPYFYMGICQTRVGQFQNGKTLFGQALSASPGHALATLELGITESEAFGQLELGLKYLNIALNGEEGLLPEQEARGRYSLAKIFSKTGQAIKAKSEIQRALGLDPTNPDITFFAQSLGETSAKEPGCIERMAIGDEYSRKGNKLAAQAQYKAAFRCDATNARAALKVGEALWNLRQPGPAIDYIKKSLIADPRYLDSYILLADYYSQEYNFEDAFKTLESASKIDRTSFLIYRGLAQVAFRRGDYATADQFARQSNKLYQNDISTNLLLAKIAIGKRDPSAALNFAKVSVALDKNSPEAQVLYGKVLGIAESPARGVVYLKELINTFPNESRYRLGLAELYLENDEALSAMEVLGQIVVAEPTNKEALELMGDAANKTGNLDKAINSYFEATKLDPSNMSAAFKMGDTYLKVKDYGLAQKQFEEVVKRNPKFPRAQFNLAVTFDKMGMSDEALSALGEEKRLNPKLEDPYELAGDIYANTKRFELATQEYQKAIELKSEGCAIFIKIASAYRNQGLLDNALVMLKLAITKESGCSAIYREQGVIFEQKSMAKEAVLSYKKYLALEPNAVDSANIKEKIEDIE